MRILCFLLISLGLFGCASGFVYQKASDRRLDAQKTVRLAGSVHPWGLDFTALSYFEEEQVRLIVLSPLGMTLLDGTISQDQALIHTRQEQFPAVAVNAFIRFARARLRTSCPGSEVTYTDARTRAVFQAEVLCP